MKDQRTNRTGRYNPNELNRQDGAENRDGLQQPSPGRPGESGERNDQHPFYGNAYTNMRSADVPEPNDARRDRNSDDRPDRGPQLLDDDYYFG